MSYTFIYLHRLHFPSESGQTIQVLRHYHALAVRGETVHIYYRARSPLSESEVDSTLKFYGLAPLPTFHLHCIEDGILGGVRLRNAARGLVRSADSRGPVILVARTLSGAEDALAVRDGARDRPISVFLELHETAIPHLVYREEGRGLKAWWAFRKEVKLFRNVDGIICTTRPQSTLLDELFPRHAPVVLLPNGVPLEMFKDARGAQRTDDLFRLRYAGQLSGWKNIEILVEVLCHLPSRTLLEIAGGKKEDGRRRDLAALAGRLGVSARVHDLGFLSPGEVPDFLAGADCLLLPLGDNVRSRYFTSPMKLFEYAASGVPMVVTRQPSTLSLLEEGVHALMAEPNSSDDMAKAIRRLMSEPLLGRRLADNALGWVVQHSLEARAQRYLEFIEERIG